mmetsp:Transcript_16193/g.44282  ORF Transcript_16193/g.44282 Transcript_16193/m.44282 type:complete len:202 (+) Transcript_16193:1037-1642(+)
MEYATPRMRFTMPSSTRLTGGSCFMMGTLSMTSPPPIGLAPLLKTFSSSPLSSTPSRFNKGRVTVRMTSMLGSKWSLVMPFSVMDKGFLPKSAKVMRGSRNHPTLRDRPQSWNRPGPPTMTPGLYFRDVPVSLISTTHPFVSFSIKRKKEASKSRSPGLVSLSLMSSIRIDFPLRVDRSSLSLKLFEPLNLSSPMLHAQFT